MPCHSCYIYGIWRSKELGGGFKVVWWEAKRGKPQRGEGAIFISELTPSAILSELPISTSFSERVP